MHQMDTSSLLHALHVFLHDDLGSLLLPPRVEEKRLSLLDQIARTCHRTATSHISDTACVEPAPHVPVYQSQPLQCVTRPLTASSISLSHRLRGPQHCNETGNKRYSLPPECMSWTPAPLPTIPSVTTGLPQWSADRDRYLRASTEPPLPPKLGSCRVSAAPNTTNSDYEIPRALVATSRQPSVGLRRCADEPPHSSGVGGVAGLSRYLHVAGSPVRSLINRLSLSPQSEVLLHSIPATQAVASTGTIVVCSTSGHSECQDDTVLTLPKKCLTSQSRRCSAYLDCGWTLAGSLHHRVKPNKWVRLSCCYLTTASRLIGHKSATNPSLASPTGPTPVLVLFLCGASAVYAGRDSGMEHVIKIGHPSWGTCALATETEEQAVVWIRQVNQYAQGITPTESVSFLDQPTSWIRSPAGSGSYAASSAAPTTTTTATIIAVTATTASCITGNSGEAVLSATRVASGVNQPDGLVQHCRHSVVELQDDSGFSAPISSGSEGNSADGVVRQTAGSRDVEPYSTEAPALRQPDDISLQYSLSQVDGAPSASKKSVRRESLLSSMRRKVESFSSKRWARKSLPQSFQTTVSPTAAGTVSTSNAASTGQSQRLSKAASTTQLIQPRQRTSSETAGSTVENLAGLSVGPMGFGWAQLELAGNLLPRRSNTLAGGGGGGSGGHHLATALLPGQSSLAKRSGKPRPQSAIIDRSWYNQQHHQGRSDQVTSTVVSIGHQVRVGGETVLLAAAAAAMSTSTTASRIIVAGEAQISVPGRLPWTNLWCCLRSHCLDIYSLANQPEGSEQMVNYPRTSCPVFSLPLEPGRVEFGLAGEKRRKSALRLAAPGQSTAALFFDVAGDKVRMGAWIRGFIQALGIIPANDERPPDTGQPQSQATSTSPVSTTLGYVQGYSSSMSGESVQASDTASQVHLIGQNPGYIYDCPVEPALLVEHTGSSGVHPCDVSLRLGDVTEESEESGEVAGLVNTASQRTVDVGDTANLYDDVCPTSYTNPQSGSFKRHWSSPLLFPTASTQPGNPMVTPLRSLSQTGPYDAWCIPPPSRRLLCQPLPPLPSVGPSGTESLAGTIASSRGATSASLTPDGVDEPATDDVFVDWPTGGPCAVQPKGWSAKANDSRVVDFLSAGRLHHSSLGVGEYAHVDQHQGYYVPTVSFAIASPNSLSREQVGTGNGDANHPDYDYAVSYCQRLANDTALLSANASTIGAGCPLVPAYDNGSNSGTHIGNYSGSDLLLPPSGASGNAMTAAWILPQAVAAARRSVSCITSSKPIIPIAPVSRETATLPSRCNCTSPASGHGLPIRSDGSLSSTISRTATSGVSSTPGGLSSSSSASLSLGRIIGEVAAGSTRPSSLLVAVPPLTEEESPVDRELPTEDSQCHSPRQATVGENAGCRGERGTSADAGEAPASLPNGSVENAWAVEAAAQQLEEVRDEVEKLRRRRKTLSFRLSRQLGKEPHESSGQSPPPTADKSDDGGVLESAQADSWSPTVPTDSPGMLDPDSKTVAEASEGDQGSASVSRPPSYSTTSLCARLAIVETMLLQAELTEARLLKDLSHCKVAGATAGLGSGTAQPEEEEEQEVLTSALEPGNRPAGVRCSAPTAVRSPDHVGASSRPWNKRGHHGPCGRPFTQWPGSPANEKQAVAAATSAGVLPSPPATGFHHRGGRPRRGYRGSRWRNRQPAGWQGSAWSQPAEAAAQSTRWRPRKRNHGNGMPLMGVAAVCSSAQD